jgi:EAL domain-containing protein (putative c-di-GMP-specific phosphodiesterase class I)
MKQAGAAVRNVKSTGGKAFCFHTASMEHAAKSRFALEDDLRRAMDARELVLYFQPRVALVSGRIEGAEALVRWRASDGTVREPDEFIGVAEASGLIQPLGRWVLEEACRQQVAWLAAGLDALTIAVNVSPVQLRDAGFVDHVAATFAASGVNPSCIELEITESATLDPGAHIDERLQQLAALGTRIAIDDFGTGYSSLSHLTRLPVHTLKIDRSFLRALPAAGTSREVVATIISMATHLGLATVAEGVETEAEAKFLRRCGCRLGQGFLFGKPMSAEEFMALAVGAR